jgi:hypothetical protein
LNKNCLCIFKASKREENVLWTVVGDLCRLVTCYSC